MFEIENPGTLFLRSLTLISESLHRLRSSYVWDVLSMTKVQCGIIFFRADLILWIDPRQFSPTGVSLLGSFFPMLLGCHFYFYSYLKARCRITLHLNPQPMCPNTAPVHQKEANNVNPGCRTTFSGPTTWFNSVYP